MENEPTIIDFYANINTSNLHPKREAATALLLEMLNIKPEEHILEIGFGTAATLVWAASKYNKSYFYGLEHNMAMFNKGKSRVRLCRIKNVRLLYDNDQDMLPFPDCFFDKVYAESVLAIQNEDGLEQAVKEIYRVLKPGGVLVVNEGLWSNTFAQEQIMEMNSVCQAKFGIIQANEKHPYINDWGLLFEKRGFVVEKIEDLECIKRFPARNKPLLENTISKVYSYYGQFLLWTNRTYRKQFTYYKKEMAALALKGKYLNGYLIHFTKREPSK